MAKVYVTCCSRCGAAYDDKQWTTGTGGRRVHICSDGIVGSEGEYDEMKPETRPKLPTPPVSDKALSHVDKIGLGLPATAAPVVIWSVPLQGGRVVEITDHMLFKKLRENEIEKVSKGKTISDERVRQITTQCYEYVAAAIEGGEAMVGYANTINRAVQNLIDEHAEKALGNEIKRKFYNTDTTIEAYLNTDYEPPF